MYHAEEAGRQPESQHSAPRVVEVSRDHLWPAAIAIALALVVAVNMIFIYIAVSEADEVVPSYQTEAR